MAYVAKILKDSLSPHGDRLTTMEVSFPRIVLAEFNTHRMFSRNSASSRAIPISKMIERVTNDPFLPVYWGKNQKGMQAQEELSPEAQILAQEFWLQARDAAVKAVQRLQEDDIDLHKQIANRLLEPWLYHTVIVTATEWDNFWGLRCDPMAQPEIRKVADMMREAYDASKPDHFAYGQWHRPLVTLDEFLAHPGGKHAIGTPEYAACVDYWNRVSVGRCARVSYLTHDGKRDPDADIELANRLQKSGHMSPFEHCARPMGIGEYAAFALGVEKFCGNFRGWVQVRKEIPNENNFLKVARA